MVWVLVGVFAGIVAALAMFGFALATNAATRAYYELLYDGCTSSRVAIEIVDAIRNIAAFIAAGILLFFSRKGVERSRAQRYGEFAKDVGSWYSFGSMLAYCVSAVPLALLALFNSGC